MADVELRRVTVVHLCDHCGAAFSPEDGGAVIAVYRELADGSGAITICPRCERSCSIIAHVREAVAVSVAARTGRPTS